MDHSSDLYRKSVLDACAILSEAFTRMESATGPQQGWTAPYGWMLINAIRHIAYPDRDVYPKRRWSTKRDPVRLR